MAVLTLSIIQAPGQAGDPGFKPMSASAGTQSVPSGGVLVVGDSLTVGSSAFIAEAVSSREVEVIALGGLQAAQAVDYLADKNLDDIETVVVALGTNDYWFAQGVGFDEVVTAMIEAARGRRIIWVNVDLGSVLAGADAINKTIEVAAASHRNVEIADWNAFINSISGHDMLRTDDGIHYTEDGYRLRGAWVADLLVTG